jgi:DNA polymerase-3 subunit beta
LSHLQIVGRVIASKNSIPILESFLFDLKGNELTVTASDAETRMVTTIQVTDTDGEGTVAIAARNLLDSLKELPEQPITFEIDENKGIIILYENGKYNFIGEKGDDYPQFKPLNDDAVELLIPSSVFFSGINHALFATADDELRPVMNGVFLDISADDIIFVASDGHKLVRYKTSEAKGQERSSFILPKKPANLLKTILPKESGECKILFNNNNAYFTLENFQLSCRLIEGRYPNYNAVIPQNNPYKVTVDRLLFTNALKRVAIFSNPSSSLVKLQLTANQIVVSAQDIDYSTSAEETVACVYNGDNMSIGFKGTFLIEILSNAPSSEIVLELADPSRAGLILPSENATNEELLMLLMPMMLNE